MRNLDRWEVLHVTHWEGEQHTWQFLLEDLGIKTKTKLVRHCLSLAKDKDMPFGYVDAAEIAKIIRGAE